MKTKRGLPNAYEYLPSDTEKGLKEDFKIVKKYTDLVRTDRGGEINNLKHLRGAATVLLVQRPDNYVFILLKAFTIFIIEKENKDFIKEAQLDFYNGFLKLSKTGEEDILSVKDKVEYFKNKLSDFDTELNLNIAEIEDVLYHKIHTDWIKAFNSKFIGELLANLFLQHYAMDRWLELKHKTVSFARYADDAILHCQSKAHAEQLLNAIRKRMEACGLEMHPEKTKLVYCRDYRRQCDFPVVKFDFLGYSFQPRTTKSKKTGKLFLGYDCAISINSKKRIADKMEELNIVGLTFKSIVGVAQFLNPFIRGWVNYYGKFRKFEMNSIFQLLRKRLVRWARKRYKRYKTSVNRAYKWLETVRRGSNFLTYFTTGKLVYRIEACRFV